MNKKSQEQEKIQIFNPINKILANKETGLSNKQIRLNKNNQNFKIKRAINLTNNFILEKKNMKNSLMMKIKN